MQKTDTAIKDYLASLPEENRADMTELHKMISSASGQAGVMWEGVFWGGSMQRIIGYGDWSAIRSDKKKVDWFIAGLALQKNYITVYVNAVKANKYTTDDYKDKLGKAKVGKSTVSFKKLADIDTDQLTKLVTEAFK